MRTERPGMGKQEDISANPIPSADTSSPHDPASIPVDPSDTSAPVTNSSRRGFLKSFAGLSAGLLAAGLSAGEQTPAQAAGIGGTPGAAKPWQASVPVYSGAFGLNNGNTQLVLPVCGWGGLGSGVRFTLVFNSQSTRTSSLGAKWTHSLNLFLTGSGPIVFVDGDGSETAYTLTGGAYVAPAGCYDVLTHNADGTWTLAMKGGSRYAFSSTGLLTSIADNNGLTTTLTYTSGLLTSVRDPAGRVLTLTYNGAQLASVKDCQNKTYTLAYVNNLPVSISTPPLFGQTYTQQIGYDANGNVATLSDRLSRTWGYTYSGNILSGTLLPGGASAGISGGIKAVAQQPAPPPGSTSNGNIAIVPHWPANVVTSNNWQDASGNNTQYGFDNLDQLVAVVDASGGQTVHTYDNSHNCTATQLPSGNTWHSTFDNAGNELVRQDPLGHQTSRTYNVQGHLLTNTDANNHTITYGYDQNGNVTSIQDGNGNTVAYGVNNLGQQTSLKDGENREWLYGYDANGYRTHIADPQGNVTQLVYTSVGQVSQRTDARNRVTNYTLDDWGRTTSVAYPTTGNPSLGFSYNAEGQLTLTSDYTGIRTYQYNTLGQRTGMTDPRGNTSATYDNLNNLLTQTDVTGRQITNTISALSQLVSVSDGSDGARAVYTYTADGLVNTLTYPNGTKTTYGYDTANRIISLTHTKVSSGSLLVGYTATYDNGGRMTQIVEQPSGDVTTFTYDSSQNLLSEIRTGTKPYSGTYTYDRSNRRLTARVVTNGVVTHNGAYSYDTAGQPTLIIENATNPPTSGIYTWNADGTLASYPGPAGSGYKRLLEYDEAQHLVRIKHDLGGGNVQTAYEYGYAADGGRRWQKDYGAGVWTWYPCGVACSAGELVEQTSDLTGNAWTTSALYMKANNGCTANIIRRNGEYHYPCLTGEITTFGDANGTILASRIYSYFGVQQSGQGTAGSPMIYSGQRALQENMQAADTCIVVVDTAVALTNLCGQRGLPPIYGNYCGPLTPPGQPPPIDALDTCCQTHDNCYGSIVPGCGFRDSRLHCKKCDKALCLCAGAAVCGTWYCRVVRIGVGIAFC